MGWVLSSSNENKTGTKEKQWNPNIGISFITWLKRQQNSSNDGKAFDAQTNKDFEQEVFSGLGP